MVVKFLKGLTDPNPAGAYFMDMRVFGGGKGGKSPSAPDPTATAAAQTQMNKDTALWNSALGNVNQITPYGTMTWTLGSATPTGGQTTQQGSQSSSVNNTQQNPQNSVAYMDLWKQYDQAKNTGSQLQWYYLDQLNNFNKNNSSNSLSSSSGGSNSTGNQTIGGFNIGDTPQWTSTITLSPEQQAILDSEQRRMIQMGLLGEDQIGRIRNSVSNPYSYDGLTSANDYATAAENAMYARLDPQFAKDEEALRTRLINQGIGQGSQAYQREMESFNQMKNDARQQAVLSGQQYGLAGRNQEISEYNAQRNAPLNEYIALTSGTQVTNPSFSSGAQGGAQAADYAGLVNQNYQNQMAQYNARQAQSNSTMGSLFGLGGSFLGAAGAAGGIGALFSDSRLKENIKAIGENKGHSIYRFNYKEGFGLPKGTFVGVMAQEVEEKMPEAVSEINGYKAVNYPMIGLEMYEVYDVCFE